MTTSKIQFKSTMDVEVADYMGDDASIVNAARISSVDSTGPNWGRLAEDLTAKDEGLINFLMRDRHGTPFEHNSLTFRISAPLFVFYEFHRHRVGWSYNEESARYRELEPVFYVPSQERSLRQTGKPGAYTFEPGDYKQQRISQGTHTRAAMTAWSEYQWMLDHGIAREVARNVLPVSIYKSMYATCNVRSLLSFLTLRRTHPASTVPTFPLREIEMVAEQMEEAAYQYFPLALDAFTKNGRVAP